MHLVRRPSRWLVLAATLVHPGPTAAVVTLSGVLGAILLAQVGRPLDERWLLTVASVAGSQVFTGALNDLVDQRRDAAAGRMDKPLASGALSPGAATWIASAGLGLQLAASLQLGLLPLLLGLAAAASAAAYNLALSRTALSPLPYVVSFGILPAWIAAGVGIPLERIAAGIPLAGIFAAAAHLANTLRDFDGDALVGSRPLAQRIGRRPTHVLAMGLSLGVGAGVGLTLLLGAGRPGLPSLALGVVGLGAVAQGAFSERRLWMGMLIAAVAWTAAWGLTSG